MSTSIIDIGKALTDDLNTQEWTQVFTAEFVRVPVRKPQECKTLQVLVAPNVDTFTTEQTTRDGSRRYYSYYVVIMQLLTGTSMDELIPLLSFVDEIMARYASADGKKFPILSGCNAACVSVDAPSPLYVPEHIFHNNVFVSAPALRFVEVNQNG